MAVLFEMLVYTWKMIHIWHLQPWGCAERATQTTAIGPGMECETRIVTTVSLQLKAAYTTTKLTQLKKCTIGTQQKKAFHKINRKSNLQLLVYYFNWCSLHKVASLSFASQLIVFHSNQSVDAIIVLDCYWIAILAAMKLILRNQTTQRNYQDIIRELTKLISQVSLFSHVRAHPSHYFTITLFISVWNPFLPIRKPLFVK